jgi:hypothetical protein
VAHILVGEPAPTSPEHALADRTNRFGGAGQRTDFSFVAGAHILNG